MPKLEKYEKTLDYSYALGLFPCMEALNKAPQLVKRVILCSDISSEALRTIENAAQKYNIRLEYADKLIKTISQKQNCFAAAVFEKKEPELDAKKNHIVLHNISDKGNLGTILRSALGFGFLDIAIISPACDKFDPQVIRASMGAMFSMRVRDFSSFEEYESGYKNRAFYPLMLDSSRDIGSVSKDSPTPFSLILGNEGSGLPSKFKHIGQAVIIPHSRDIDSLNLSIAASIAMYLFAKYNK